MRVIVAAFAFVALVLVGGAAGAQGPVGGAGSLPSTLLLAQSEPQTSATTGTDAPSLRGAPALPIGVGSRGIDPAERRVALVVGNQAYQHLPRLATPNNDAQLIATTLQSLGFQLIGGKAQTDLDRAGFEQAIREFGMALRGGSVGLFYYAGHGVQVRGNNYLVPVGANPTSAADVDFELIDAALVLIQMEVAGSTLNFVILDACRNNPFGGRGLRDSGGGLAQMKVPTGTLISYATGPGNVAADGTGSHSPYAAALADAMRRPGLPVLEVFNRVAVEVNKATGGHQEPWTEHSPLEGNFYFLGPTTVTVTPSALAPAPPLPQAEIVFWQSIEKSKTAADFEEYLRKYPTGQFAGLAQNRLAALRPPSPAAPPSTAKRVSHPRLPPRKREAEPASQPPAPPPSQQPVTSPSSTYKPVSADYVTPSDGHQHRITVNRNNSYAGTNTGEICDTFTRTDVDLITNISKSVVVRRCKGADGRWHDD